MPKTIGALTISQSPRDDLLAPLIEHFPDDTVIEAGALDGIDTATLPDGADAPYPLTTRLHAGSSVTLDRGFLAPLLGQALDTLEAQGVIASILLCAGAFPDLAGNRPLLKPFEFACVTLRAIGIRRIAVVSPIEIQRPPIQAKWIRAGFEPLTWVAPEDAPVATWGMWLNEQMADDSDIACVVLDYVGYPTEQVLALQATVDRPVFDLGHLAVSAFAEML